MSAYSDAVKVAKRDAQALAAKTGRKDVAKSKPAKSGKKRSGN